MRVVGLDGVKLRLRYGLMVMARGVIVIQKGGVRVRVMAKGGVRVRVKGGVRVMAMVKEKVEVMAKSGVKGMVFAMVAMA